MEGPITINKASGSVILASDVIMNQASMTFTMTSGTFDIGAYTFNNSVMACDHNGGTITGTGAFKCDGYDISGGTFTGTNMSSVDIDDQGITMSGGTFDATVNTTYNEGLFDNSAGGTFNHNDGTYVSEVGVTHKNYDFDTSETFYNFTNDRFVNDIKINGLK